MATVIFRTPPNLRAGLSNISCNSSSTSKSHKFPFVSFVHRRPNRCSSYSSLKISNFNGNGDVKLPSPFDRLLVYGSNNGDSVETQTETREKEEQEVEEPITEENGEDTTTAEDTVINGESVDSAIIVSLQMYREALANNDESKMAEIEAFLRSIEDEKSDLERKVATLTEEVSNERDRVLRISADFENFRKRVEREKLSLVSNAQGEVVENLLPVLDNFERAKAQIKIETEGEEKINNSYQSIYKQFVEILGSLGVVAVETVGKPFDPMLHEAIMREDSAEFEEGVIIDEFRKGFTLGDRLLRPSMVKVSAGPGPTKPQTVETSDEQESEQQTTGQQSAED